LGAVCNLQKISANTIFHGIEHKNPSFEKILVQKLIKKSHLERVRFRTQTQNYHGSKISAILLRDTYPLAYECVPQKNGNRESTRLADPAQTFTEFSLGYMYN
jgi:hypothetical protein